MLRVGAGLLVVFGLTTASAAAAGNAPSRLGLGEKVPTLTYLDAAGKTRALAEVKGKAATVVVFLSFDCPVSKSYSEPLAEMAKAYGSKGVAFFGIGTSEDEDAAALAKKAADFKLPFPVFKDDKLAWADALHAETTPEVFVLDAGLVLRYRGRIDDGYAARLRKKNGRDIRQDLRLALDEVVAGKAVTEPATRAVGCPIARPDKRPLAGSNPRITYYRDVLPILQDRCQQCHRPGEVGPFSLMTYRQAATWADDIKTYTQERAMPPWKPVAGPAFHNERRLPAGEIAVLAAWADAGAPAGDPQDAPPPRRFTEGWQLGTPDLILEPAKSFHLGAAGRDHFRCYVLKTDEASDRYVTAIEVRPGNRRVVHHALIFVDTSGQGRQRQAREQEQPKQGQKDFGPGYYSSMGPGFRPSGGLGGWAPGQMARHLPDGTGYYLPRGADVIVQIHYHRDGRDADDRSKIGLYFAKKPVARRFQSIVIPGRFLFIPAGNDHYTVRGSVIVRQDCDLHSVMGHMHMLGKEVTITLYPPEGEPRPLLAIKDWDYNWQETYFFKDAVKVKAGTRLEIRGIYDNTDKNPNNPNKPARLVWAGDQTDNEMLFGFIGATSATPGRIRVQRLGPAKAAK